MSDFMHRAAIVLLFCALVWLLWNAMAGVQRMEASAFKMSATEAEAVMLKHADIVPDEHGNPTFRWREAQHD